MVWLVAARFIGNRIASFLLMLASSTSLLFVGLRFFQISILPQHLFFILLAIPLSASDPITFSYNNTAASFAYCSVACILAGLIYHNKAWLLLAGLFAATVWCCKISSGLLLLVILPLIILCVYHKRLAAIAIFFTGWLVYAGIHGWWFTPLHKQWMLIQEVKSFFIAMDPTYSEWAALQKTYLFLVTEATQMAWFFCGFLLVRLVKPLFLKWIIYLTLLGWFGYLFYTSDYRLTGLILALSITFLFADFTAFHISSNLLSKVVLHSSKLWVALLLLLLPLIICIGTNNHFYHNYVFGGVPILLLCFVWYYKHPVPAFGQVSLLLIAGCIWYVCYVKILFQPYRIAPIPRHKKRAVNFPYLKNILLNDEALHGKSQLEKQGFAANNYLICLGKMPGFIRLFEANAPGGIMFSPVYKELYLYNLQKDYNQCISPVFVLADYRFADSLSLSPQNWEYRFTNTLFQKMPQHTSWHFCDSVPLFNAPLRKLYIYKAE
jgi:hypothetical protein